MNKQLSFLSFLLLGSLGAATSWVPQFDDKPVRPVISSGIDQALPVAPIVSVKAPRRVLVFSATAGYRHDSIPAGKEALVKLGIATGAYEAIVSDSPNNFEAEALRGFDAVVLLNPTLDFFMPHRKQREQFSEDEWAWLQARHNRLVDNLVDYVEAGGGLVGIHSATDACYGHSDYVDMIGGLYDGHPWVAYMDLTIVVEDGEHAVIKPVFGGMKDFSIKDEIYQFKPDTYSRDHLRVLLNLDPERSDDPKGTPKREDGDYAVCWVQSVGKGRVFYSGLGHRQDIFSNPLMLKHYLAGIQFATGDLEADTTPSAQIQIPNITHTANEWVSLFDGETLNGWSQRDGKADYQVRDGNIVGVSALNTPNSFLCSDNTYGDFELEFDVKCGAINSGMQIRSHANKLAKDGVNLQQRVNGPQIEIERSPGQAGYVYGEAYSGWRSPEPQSKDPEVNAHSLFKNDEWNHYRIVARGARIQTWINGEKVANLYDLESHQLYPDGFIALQVHSHQQGGLEIKWRNLRIREIN